MSQAPLQIHYHEAVADRRSAVAATLALAGIQVRRASQYPELAADVRLLLVGLAEGPAALTELATAADRRPGVPIVVLAPGASPERVLLAVRAGARDVITEAADAAEALARAARRQAPRPGDARPGRLIAVFALKGGVGKSMVAANLAIALARIGRTPVTAVDLSLPSGNLDMYFDLAGSLGVTDMLSMGAELDPRALKQALLPHASGVSLLAGPRADAPGAAMGHSSRPLFEMLLAQRQLVVVDTGAYLDEAQVGALEAADLIVVPVSPLISSVTTLTAIRTQLATLGIPPERVLPVLNQAFPDARPLTAEVLERLLPDRANQVLPWGGAEAARALDDGRPLAQFARRAPFARAIDALAADALLRVRLPEPPPPTVIDRRMLGRGRALWALLTRSHDHVPA